MHESSSRNVLSINQHIANNNKALLPLAGDYPLEQVTFNTLILDNLETTSTNLNNIKSIENEAFDLTLLDGKDNILNIATGMQLTYRQSWYAEGVALGQLLYSLSLAPGEVVRIAIQDWSRKTSGQMSEQATEEEGLSNQNLHSRSVSEVTKSLAREAQNGFSESFSSSTSSSSGKSSGGSFFGLFGGGSSGSQSSNSSRSSSFTSSYGRRNIAASMNQNVRDRTQQLASAARNRYATTIYEVTEQEQELASTRVVANYNHMHALTMQYYEMIQIYRTKLQLISAEKCLLLPVKLIDFTDPNILAVDEIKNFLKKYAISEDVHPKELKLKIEMEPSLSECVLSGGTWVNWRFKGTLYEQQLQAYKNMSMFNYYDVITYREDVTNVSVSYTIPWDTKICKIEFFEGFLKYIELYDSFILARSAKMDGTDNRVIQINKTIKWGSASTMKINNWPYKIYFLMQNNEKIYFDEKESYLLLLFRNIKEIGFEKISNNDEDDVLFTPGILIQLEYGMLLHRKLLFIPSVRCKSFERFGHKVYTMPIQIKEAGLQHLHLNRNYYNNLLYSNFSPTKLAAMLSRYTYRGKSLLSQVDPKLLKMVGNYLVFKMGGLTLDDRKENKLSAECEKEIKKWMSEQGFDFNETFEDTVALPSGGVHAEGILGLSNCAEKLDLTRFWNWQESPIPILPPEIAAVNMGSHAQPVNNNAPQFSQRQLHMVDPTPLPDPTPLAHTFQAIAQGQMFRDMSAREATSRLAQTSLETTARSERHAAEQASESFATVANAQLEIVKALASAASGSSNSSPSHLGARLNFANSLDNAEAINSQVSPNNSDTTNAANLLPQPENKPAVTHQNTKNLFDRQVLGSAGSIAHQVAKVGLLNHAKHQTQSSHEREEVGRHHSPQSHPQSQPPSNHRLGDISMQEESGKRDPIAAAKVISNGNGDPGGKSYGMFQLSSAKRTLQRFLHYYETHANEQMKQYKSDAFAGLIITSKEFDVRWQAIANDPGFAELQHAFIKATHYDPLEKHARNLGIEITFAIAEALWSISVQHGRAKLVVSNAHEKLKHLRVIEEHHVLEALYAARSEYISSLNDLGINMKNNILKRYDRELKKLLAFTYKPNLKPSSFH